MILLAELRSSDVPDLGESVIDDEALLKRLHSHVAKLSFTDAL